MKTVQISHNHDLNYIVTILDTKGKQVLKSEVWNPSQPLALGHPIAWVLEKTSDGIRLRNISSLTNILVDSQCEEISNSTLKNNKPIKLPHFSVRIRPLSSLSELAEESKTWHPTLIHSEEISEKKEDDYFKKSVIQVFVSFIVLGAVALLWPQSKPNPEEIIPPQLAKVLLSPAFKKPSNPQHTEASAGKSSHDNNVVQAFRSEAVQKTTQKLIKTGALSLLTHSDLLGTKNSKAAVSAIFDSKSKLSQTEKISPDNLNPKDVKVDMLGGTSKGDVGYSKGNNAKVDGQGSSFVSLDSKEATVEEGLTTDEVGKVIHAHLSEIRYCYESSMLRNPSIEGKLTIDFTIRNLGTVKSAQVKNSTLTDSSLDQCILSHLLTWKFPKPKGGIDVAVTYPFIFKSLGK